MMKRLIPGVILTVATLAESTAVASTLEEVAQRGELVCGVAPALPGFSTQDANEVWQGFDVALCRAVAAAVLADPMAVRFVPATGQDRFELLQNGEIDLLARNLSRSFDTEVSRGIAFAGVSFHDSQGFMAHRDTGITAAADLEDAAICVEAGTAAQARLGEYLNRNNLAYDAVDVESHVSGRDRYRARDCDVVAASTSTLAAMRAGFGDPDAHVILSETISRDSFGPAVRDGDTGWKAVVRWVLFALIAAEELGVTSANLDDLSDASENREIINLLGGEGGFGERLGLDAAWAQRAIAAGGNYGEIFASHIGEQTPIGLARGLNAQWTDGGLIYAMPFR